MTQETDVAQSTTVEAQPLDGAGPMTPLRAWTGRWIEPTEAVDLPDAQRPAYHLAGEFDLAERPISAVLSCSARGLYEVFVNGHRVGDHELTPGFTAYRKRIHVQTFDVASLLRPGRNALGILLSDGWWRGQAMITRASNRYGSSVAAIAEIEISCPSAGALIVGTDATWLSSTGHILAADLMAGEYQDLRLALDGWAAPGTDRRMWRPVRVADHATDVLVPTTGPPVRRAEEIAPVSVRKVGADRYVVDFGRNINGWVRLTDLGPRDTRLTIKHGEALTSSGDDIDNKPHTMKGMVVEREAPVPFQTDVVISAGDGSVFEPRHSTKGFRFVRVDGHPGPLDARSLTAVVVRNDLRKVGDFSCSSDELNELHRVAEWSFLTNACDIPTDCPTRERAGWTGDWQIFAATAAYLYDVTDFSRKWLKDLAADQLETGAVTQVVPNPIDFARDYNQWLKAMQGPAGWGDAAVHVPWELYVATGRRDVLEEAFPAMRKWVDFAARSAREGRHPARIVARVQPLPHEHLLWDSGFHFGEWNEPVDESAVRPDPRDVDHGPTATAYLCRSAYELSLVAGVLGDDESAQRYGRLAADVRRAWRSEFIVNGRVQPSTQPNLVRALAFGLVPESLRERAVRDLARLIRDAGTHLGTGFLSTPFLLPVLADHGELGLAYELLLQRTRPSWLAMMEAGATTIWESWDAVSPEGRITSSLNHFSMGAVISFLHHHVAGLRTLSPGYRRFRVCPRPGGGLKSAGTYHDSPYGRIAVSWSVASGEGELTVTVPPGTEAELVTGTATELVGVGTHVRTWRM